MSINMNMFFFLYFPLNAASCENSFSSLTPFLLNITFLAGGGHKGLMSGNKPVSIPQYSNMPGGYMSNQQHARGTGQAPLHQQSQIQQKSSGKYSSSSPGMINTQNSNVSLSSLNSTPQVRTRSPHAKVRGSG